MRRYVLLLVLGFSVASLFLILNWNSPRSQSIATVVSAPRKPLAQTSPATPAPHRTSPGVPTAGLAPTPAPAPAAIRRPLATQPPSARIRRIVDNQAAYRDRMIDIHALGNNLSKEEVNALLDFLHLGADTRGNLNLLAFNAIKNDILDALIKTEPLPENLGAEIMSMYREQSLDVVWRDYCVQHFAPYYDKKWPPGTPADKDDPEKAAILTAFREALSETQDTIAGTALIGLECISASHADVSRAWVASNALALAADEGAAAAPRLTALQICSITGAREVLPTASILAQTGETLPLRLSAVATLSELGGSADRELLQSLSADAEPLVAKAANKAMNKLDAAAKP